MARTRGALLATVAAAAAASAQPPVRGAGPIPADYVVPTTYGPVKGAAGANGTAVWQSIPFAAPPVGALRFHAPVPPTPWTAPRDVTGPATPCPQLKLDGVLLVGSEDCLYLTVHVPLAAAAAAAANGTSLPVYVWVFGGAWIVGDEEEFGMYDGAHLAEAGGFIVVAMNYRVGPFGFMALPALQDEDPDHSTGNAAIQDQRAALGWVRDNIAAFGGDPARVTLGGESAGCFSGFAHLVSPASAGLFHGLICESGTTQAPQFFQDLGDAMAFNALYGTAVGCPQPPNVTSAQQLACLRGKSTEDILKSVGDWLNPNWPFSAPTAVPEGDAAAAAAERAASGPLLGRYVRRTAAGSASVEGGLRTQVDAAAAVAAALRAGGGGGGGAALGRMPALSPLMPWGVAIDGRPTGMPGMPLDLIRAGTFNKVPVVFGTNMNEGSIFVPAFTLIVRNISWPLRDEDLPRVVAQAYSMYDPAVVANATASLVMPAYPASAYPDNFHRASDMITQCFFRCAGRRTARALAAAGVPTWLYEWRYNATNSSFWLYPFAGDAHGSELLFVFRNEVRAGGGGGHARRTLSTSQKTVTLMTPPPPTASNPLTPAVVRHVHGQRLGHLQRADGVLGQLCAHAGPHARRWRQRRRWPLPRARRVGVAALHRRVRRGRAGRRQHAH
jgi:carboxylesterase type B